MTPLDLAYRRLADRDLEYGNALSVHAPMVVEVLHRLGADERIEGWLDRRMPKLRPAPARVAAIANDGVDDALGEIDRAQDWVVFFDDAIATDGPRAVLEAWVPRLAPVLIGAAFHGILRVGHAARALTEIDTIDRRRELARGLAYWSARYAPLVETNDGAPLVGDADPRAAIDSLRPSADAMTPRQGLINPRIDDRIAGRADLAIVCSNVSLPRSPLAAAHVVNEIAAHVIVDFEHDRSALFALGHGVTATATVEHILPWISESSGRALVAHALVALGAMRIAFTGNGRVRAARAMTFDRVLDRAFGSDDDHDLKFGEACLRGRRRDAGAFDGVLAMWMEGRTGV